MNIRIIFFLLLILLTAPLKSQILSPESLKSVELLKDAWIFLDGSRVFCSWTDYRQIPVYIGSAQNQGVFINPDKELPAGYSQITSDTVWKIFIRKPGGVDYSGAGVGVKVDNIYYRNYLKLNSYSITFKDDYISFLEKYFSVDHMPDSVYLLINSQEYYKSIVFHEAFHIFQQKAKPWQRHKEINYLNPEIAALSYIEGSLLQQAYNSGSNEKAIELIMDFIAIRDFKNTKLSKRQINYEEDYEWIEGGAMYIQSKLLKAMLPYNQAKYVNYLDSSNFYNSIINLNVPGNKEYYYGQCQAFLLDRLCGVEWQTEILKEGICLTDLLMNAVNYDSQIQNPKLRTILASFDFASMKRELKSQFKKGNYIIKPNLVQK